MVFVPMVAFAALLAFMALMEILRIKLSNDYKSHDCGNLGR